MDVDTNGGGDGEGAGEGLVVAPLRTLVLGWGEEGLEVRAWKTRGQLAGVRKDGRDLPFLMMRNGKTGWMAVSVDVR